MARAAFALLAVALMAAAANAQVFRLVHFAAYKATASLAQVNTWERSALVACAASASKIVLSRPLNQTTLQGFAGNSSFFADFASSAAAATFSTCVNGNANYGLAKAQQLYKNITLFSITSGYVLPTANGFYHVSVINPTNPTAYFNGRVTLFTGITSLTNFISHGVDTGATLALAPTKATYATVINLKEIQGSLAYFKYKNGDTTTVPAIPRLPIIVTLSALQTVGSLNIEFYGDLVK